MVSELHNGNKQDLYAALERLKAEYPGPTSLSVDKTYNAITGSFNTFMVDGYVVSFVHYEPWFSEEPVICECLILRLYPGGKLSAALGFLEDEARRLGCKQVAVGTFLAKNDAALGRIYRRFGYSISSSQLTKEIS